MASKRGKKGGSMKSPKKEFEEEDDDFLEDLVVDTNPEEAKKTATYLNLKPGGFITKAEDRKGRLDKRHARIAVAREQDNDDDDDDNNETEKEQLERETRELESELRKTERAAEKARDQQEKEKARWFSKCIQSGVFLKQPQAVSLVQMKKWNLSRQTSDVGATQAKCSLVPSSQVKQECIPVGCILSTAVALGGVCLGVVSA